MASTVVANPVVRAIAVRALLLRERLSTGSTFNPLAPAFRLDPYPAYRALRSRDPVHRSQLLRGWVLTRYEHVIAVLRDERFSADQRNATVNRRRAGREAPGPRDQLYDHTLLNLDPPTHTRLRALVHRAFTPRMVEQLRPRVEEIVGQLLDAAEDGGRMDVIADLAYPLPLIVITDMLGVPRGDQAQFKRWSFDISLALDPLVTATAIARADRSTLELSDYLRETIAARRRRPADDLISSLIAAEDGGEVLNEREMLATCVLLLVAGHETTSSFIGNAMLALLRRPHLLQRLRDQPDAIEPAVEELLRFDSPVQGTVRVALEDVRIGGRSIKKGELVFPLFAAANRDPAKFAAPDEIDLDRRDARHLTFGYGSHFCIGAPLARMEGQIAIEAMVRRFPGLRLAPGTLRWRESLVLRGLSALPVTF